MDELRLKPEELCWQCDPNQPEYVTPQDPGPDHPYDPTPWAFPYSPSWYRHQYHPPVN